MKSLNLDNATLVNGEFLSSNSWGELAFDNDGSFSLNEQSMTFNSDGTEIVVNFNCDVEASIEEDFGSYDAPSSCEANIGDINVSIEKVYINDVEVNFNNSVLDVLTKMIEKELN